MKRLLILAFLFTSSLFGAEGPLGDFYNQSISFTRPGDTTPYASGDLVANSVTAGSVVPMTFTVGTTALGTQFTLSRIELRKNGTSITTANFRVHLYSTTSPTVSNGDNAAFLTTGTANYLGKFDVTIDQAFTDGAAGFVATGANNIVLDSSQFIYALIEARAAYTPANAEIFTLKLEGVLNR
jgi:hypothetical protein